MEPAVRSEGRGCPRRAVAAILMSLFPQYILNCGTEAAGSCHGGDHLAVYDFITQTGFVPFESCQLYAACSAESKEGTCKYGNYECSPINTCKTCSTFKVSFGEHLTWRARGAATFMGKALCWICPLAPGLSGDVLLFGIAMAHNGPRASSKGLRRGRQLY